MAERGRLYLWPRNRSFGDSKARPVVVIAPDAATRHGRRWVVLPFSSEADLASNPLAYPLASSATNGLRQASLVMTWLPTTVHADRHRSDSGPRSAVPRALAARQLIPVGVEAAFLQNIALSRGALSRRPLMLQTNLAWPQGVGRLPGLQPLRPIAFHRRGRVRRAAPISSWRSGGGRAIGAETPGPDRDMGAAALDVAPALGPRHLQRPAGA